MTHIGGGVKIGHLRAPDLPAVNVLNFIGKGGNGDAATDCSELVCLFLSLRDF